MSFQLSARSINYDLFSGLMSNSVISRWWEGMIEELEHDIECDVSNVVLDAKALNA